MTKTIARWSRTRVAEFPQLFDRSIREAKKSSIPSAFVFTAPPDLSGAPWPCASINCRLRKVDKLSRFAALYADQLAVLSPVQPASASNPRGS